MVTRSFLTLALVFLAGMGPARAQTSIGGSVLDADTGLSLPAATVQIEGTYIGTVANRDGRFQISVSDFPATLIVRHIGYAASRSLISSADEAVIPGGIEVRLTPEPGVFQEVVVTAEDPGERIMRLVIEAKQRRRDLVSSFVSEAYNRFTISNDTGIVSLTESLSDFYWDRERGGREVVQAERSTENMEFEGMMPAALFISNLYDDDVEVAGHTLFGVTHPRAIEVYDFRLVGTRSWDGAKVFDIDVSPADPLASAFVGRVSVLDAAWAMLEVELRPGDSFLFPPPIQFFDITMRQQYRTFADEVWLPVDYQSELALKVGLGKVLQIPTIKVDQLSRLSGYRINEPIPDSLYADDEYVREDTTGAASDSLLAQPGVAVPLTREEERAMASIDSTDTLDEAFQAKVRVGRRFSVNVGDDSESGRLRNVDYAPALWYNRVEGLHAGLGVGFAKRNVASIQIDAAYASAQREWEGGLELKVGPRQIQAFLTASERTLPRYSSRTRSRLLNSATILAGRQDYFDYYRSRLVEFGIEFERSRQLPISARLSLQREEGASRELASDFRILAGDELLANPLVDERTIGSFLASVRVGNRPAPFGIAGANGIQIGLERASRQLLGGSHSFTALAISGDARIPTFFRRRLIPNTLDLSLFAFWSSGRLPSHRFEIVDGSDLLSVHGGLRTLAGRPYEGDGVLFAGWEHHFRTTPFERIGWNWPVERNWGLMLFGGHGRSWLSDEVHTQRGFTPMASGGWHHEIGVSLSGVLSLLRLDVARRLDEPGWAFGVGAARLF